MLCIYWLKYEYVLQVATGPGIVARSQPVMLILPRGKLPNKGADLIVHLSCQCRLQPVTTRWKRAYTELSYPNLFKFSFIPYFLSFPYHSHHISPSLILVLSVGLNVQSVSSQDQKDPGTR